ncbi:prostaglandin G/H synthase 2 [Gadus morhua]|uniref:prostaglandin G/H synthase 2 n=1 Tax=Gadus morhua TaxID=8049 RepID=UPI0011B6B347|nr:prostaglandin G/H synthase 2 [Gadus morhua]
MNRSILAVLVLALGFLFCEGGTPCCSDPCQNRGVCTAMGAERYECDCTRTGFNGENCTNPEFFTWIKISLKPSPNTVHYLLTHFKGFWNIVNNMSVLRDAIMRYVLTSRSHLIASPPTYNSDYGYKNWEAFSNLSYYTRTLPPVANDCPTPMGVLGKKELPDIKMLAEKLLVRKHFIPDPQGSSLMFAFFAQHFTHQFFKSDMKKGPAFTKAQGHGVDLNHVYGDNLERQHKLRLHKDGKLKYQDIDGDMYPPTVASVGAEMHYPPHVPEEQRLAVGHEAFGLVPGLIMYATLWLREHNRVCDVLRGVHPDWDDERLFQTTRLILIGETIKIVIEDYVQHLSGYNFKLKFDPELLFNQRFQYQNRISSEFNTLYHWHPLMPEAFHIEEQVYSYKQFVFNTSVVTNHGIGNLVDSFTKQVSGRVAGGRNVPGALLHVAMKSIENARKMRYKSLNAYRKRFSMKPYSSFQDLTGETEMAAVLEEMYGHVDAVELYPGLLVEKPRPNAIFGETMVEMGAPYSLKGLLGNPICSPEYWKPSTFGGTAGFEIVNSASLQRLVCNNVRGPCPLASFRIPDLEQTGSVVINSSRPQHARTGEVNPTVMLKERTTEL